MTDSLLAVDYFTLAKRVAYVLGVPDDMAKWQEHQRMAVDETIEDGLRLFYTPPDVPPWPSHSWSFLHPVSEMTLQADKRWYPLPRDFDNFADNEQIAFLDNEGYPPIVITSEAKLRQYDNLLDTSSIPELAAIRRVVVDGTDVEHWEIGFHPTPDAEYRVGFQYSCAARMISEDAPHPLGGRSHAQLILLACLAAAEQREYDQRGPRYEAFIQQLSSEIAKDARKGPKTVGYNGNGERWLGTPGASWMQRDSRRIPRRATTYNSQTWGN